jgi:hypothetical protein
MIPSVSTPLLMATLMYTKQKTLLPYVLQAGSIKSVFPQPTHNLCDLFST